MESVVRRRAVVVSVVLKHKSAATILAVLQRVAEATAVLKAKYAATVSVNCLKIAIAMIFRVVLIFRTLCARNAKSQDTKQTTLVYLV